MVHAAAVFLSIDIAVTMCCWMYADATNTSGNKDVFVEDDWPLRRSYRLEDFLWSGSGDGATEVVTSPWLTTTVFRTTTIMATVMRTAVPQHTPVWTTEVSSTPAGGINPTPTLTLTPPLATQIFPPVFYPGNNTNTSIGIPDQRYWLLTVLIANTSDADNAVGLESRLASIYKIAFSRQQERHLGLGNAQAAKQMQSRQRRAQESISVHVHNISTRGDRELELLYSVRVAGRPVLAQAAATDMRLVTDLEVAAELGYPVLTKAEPYLKSLEPVNNEVHKTARTRDTWLLVAAAVSAVCLLLLLAAFVALGLGKRKRHQVVSANRQQVFQHEQEVGVANLAFQGEATGSKVKVGARRRPTSSQTPPGTTVSFQDDAGNRSSSPSSAGSSQVSLVRRRPSQPKRSVVEAETRDRPKPKPRRRQYSRESSLIKKAHSEVEDSPHEGEETTDGAEGGARKSSVVSPNSFLSMPSVKSFPRGANIPEPLARVLEPISASNLDSEDVIVLPTEPSRLTRHGSMEAYDPGIVGPIVWDLHRNQIVCQQRAKSNPLGEEVNIDDPDDIMTGPDTTASNVGRMRRRFNELLDDAFSLFGSRSVSPEESSSPPPPGISSHRGHSAIVRPVGEPFDLDQVPRPRTTDNQRPATAGVGRPRGAWASKEPSIASAHSTTLPRPLSAGPFHRPQLTLEGDPIVDRDVILTDARLPITDPAVPLIAAIKEELRKFNVSQPAPTLPGAAVNK